MVTLDVMQSLEGAGAEKNMKIGLDILMCCHGHHAQPLQPVASAHLWGLLGIPWDTGVALTKPELEVRCWTWGG